MKHRSSGILLHITSLPGDEGTGTLGKKAYDFVDFLAESRQQLWQILPLGPPGAGNSPYQCFSAFAGNPLLIDLQTLRLENLLAETDLLPTPDFPKEKVDFKAVETWKHQKLAKAFVNFQNRYFSDFEQEYRHFLKEHGWWLHDYALFMAAKEYFGHISWHQWPTDFKLRKPGAIEQISTQLHYETDYHKFLQFLFFRQWFRLKAYANSKGVQIFGDVPLYVSGESADVWANTDIFLLDNNLEPIEVGGVPPDYFSDKGQLWGNPVFDWHRLKNRDYDWWMARLHFNLNMYNCVRIDHFRGLQAYWSIPALETTAINGRWVAAFGYEMLEKLRSQIGTLPLIAEDLGIITPEVDHLRESFGLPGMKVLQFAFNSDATNKDLPHNYSDNFIVYTGTHDNDTTLGWLQTIVDDEKKMAEKYIGTTDRAGLAKVVEMAIASVAKTAIIPLPDILELDGASRMNTPGTADGNWGWRFQENQLDTGKKLMLKQLCEKYNR